MLLIENSDLRLTINNLKAFVLMTFETRNLGPLALHFLEILV